MLYLYTGSDRAKALEALNAHVGKMSDKTAVVVRISDANTLDDLQAALRSGGMFAGERIIVLNGVFANGEMRAVAEEQLRDLKSSTQHFFIFEEKPDAATRKLLEKYAEDSLRFDAPTKRKEGNIFALANALRRGDKKALWVGYQRELAAHSAPEAIHGVLFWGAKDMLMKSRADPDKSRAKKLIAQLAALPHESRRRGEELEYALERFVLSNV